jgi:hypothetical protein
VPARDVDAEIGQRAQAFGQLARVARMFAAESLDRARSLFFGKSERLREQLLDRIDLGTVTSGQCHRHASPRLGHRAGSTAT